MIKEIITNYGLLKGATHARYYPNGRICECTMTVPNEIRTPFGTFVPQYEEDGFRRKRVKPVMFYPNGQLRNLPLQKKTSIKTSIGVVSAELLTFYEDGSFKRIFGLDGMLSGFWSEEDEYELAETLKLDFQFAKIKRKVISLQFYQSGHVKNLTFWPQDKVLINSPLGDMEARIGIALYPNGKLRALEPSKPIAVNSPVGTIRAFDPRAMGIHSDRMSLSFTESGEVASLVSVNDQVTVLWDGKVVAVYKPQTVSSKFNLDQMERVPLQVEFYEDKVRFNGSEVDEYSLNECVFMVSPIGKQITKGCTSCDSCTACQGLIL